MKLRVLNTLVIFMMNFFYLTVLILMISSCSKSRENVICDFTKGILFHDSKLFSKSCIKDSLRMNLSIQGGGDIFNYYKFIYSPWKIIPKELQKQKEQFECEDLILTKVSANRYTINLKDSRVLYIRFGEGDNLNLIVSALPYEDPLPPPTSPDVPSTGAGK